MRASVYWLAVFLLATLVTQASATDWVVGDAYTVEVTRSGVTERFSGELVHANEQWVSLKSTVPGRNIGVPTKPGSRVFRPASPNNVGIGREQHLEIVPADAVKIINHKSGVGVGEVSDEQLPQLPEVGDTVAIQYAEGGKLAKARGNLTHISADGWTVSEKRGVAMKRSIPVLGQLPLVAGMFSHTVFSMQTNDVVVRAADVLSIQVHEPAVFERAKIESTQE